MASTEYLYANLSAREVAAATGGTVNFNFVAGQSIKYALRFLERSSDGTLNETQLDVLNFRAAIGRQEMSPESGWYKIKIGEGASSDLNTTIPLDWNAGPMEVEMALNAVSGRPADFHCDQGDNCLIIRRGDEQSVVLNVLSEGLRPVSFGKILGGRKFPEKNARLALGGLVYSSKLVGEQGNGIGITYIRPTATRDLSVSVSGKLITVHLAGMSVNGGPVSITSTLAQIKSGIEGSPAAAALVRVEMVDAQASVGSQDLVYLVGGANPSGYEYTLQLLQAPVVFTDWAGQQLPARPTITKIQEGGTDPSGLMKWPAIMALYVPPDFRGAYQFQRTQKTKRSTLCSKDDGVAKLQEVLQAMMADEGATMKVTNPNNNVAHIEFGGDLNGLSVETLDVSVYSSAPPDYTFELDFTRAGVFELLQSSPSVTLPFEAEAVVWVDPADPLQGTRVVKLWQTTATIKRPLIWDAQAVHPPIDWQRVASPKDYVPFSSSQVLTGQQAAYTCVIGNGSSKEFIVDHNLGGTRTIDGREVRVDGGVVSVVVRENAAGGRQLRDDEYVVRFDTESSLSLTFTAAPAQSSLAVVVIGYGSPSAFAIHTHPIDQIRTITNGAVAENLRDILEGILRRLTRLETLVPRAEVLAVASGLPAKANVAIPSIGEILPDVAMEGSGEGEPLSIASQVVVNSSNKALPPQAISGTDLDEKTKELQAEILRIKAEAGAQLAAAQAAAAQAAEQAKSKAEQEAKQKQTSLIAKLAIGGYGVVSGSSISPALYPEKRNGKYAWLLPAIHSASAQLVTAVPDVSVAAGVVYRNNGTSALSLPAGGGRKTQIVPVGGYFGGDGRAIYALARKDSSTSYFPLEMERDLIRVIIRNEQFPENSSLTLSWQIDSAFYTDMVVAGGQYVMPVSISSLPDASVPAVTGLNVGAVGASVEIMAPRLVLSRNVKETRQFSITLNRQRVSQGGASLLRGESQSMSYGVTTIGPAVPDGTLLLTVRLTQWDVDDSTSSATGQVSIMMPATQINVDQIV